MTGKVAATDLERDKRLLNRKLARNRLAGGGIAFARMERAEKAAPTETANLAGKEGIGGRSGTKGVAFEGPVAPAVLEAANGTEGAVFVSCAKA